MNPIVLIADLLRAGGTITFADEGKGQDERHVDVSCTDGETTDLRFFVVYFRSVEWRKTTLAEALELVSILLDTQPKEG